MSVISIKKTDKIENKITQAMMRKFQSTSDRKKAIHLSAAAGAAIVATLPMGTDVIALRTCEVVMVMLIAGSYGEKLTKSAAKGLMLSSFAQLVGEKAAIAALEAAEAGKFASSGTVVGPFIAWGIKSSIAVGLIESLGHIVIKYYENPNGLGAKACKVAEGVGLVADIGRVAHMVSGASGKALASGEEAGTALSAEALPAEGVADGAGSQISFCGSELSKNIHELQGKIKSQEGKVKMIEGWIESDLKFGRDTTQNQTKLKYALRELEKLMKELSRLKA